MTTAAKLKSQTRKDLAQMAKKMGLSGWHSMRKDQLVSALVRAAQAKSTRLKNKSSTSRAASKPTRRASAKTATTPRLVSQRKPAGKTPAKPKSPRIVSRIRQVNAQRERRRDLSLLPRHTTPRNGHPSPARPKRSPASKNGVVEKDRVVLLVRDPYWLQACWDVSRQSVQRARAAMAEHWHTAKPILRMFEVESGATTSSVERLARDIEIHGGVKNWYIDVHDPPKSYRVDLGYRASNGRFFALARSNSVTTPKPGSSDAIDENWTDVAENYEKIYALSGGYSDDNVGGDLQELFEERLRRPMGSPVVTQFGVGAERMLNRQRDFRFEVDAEMIIYGTTKPDAHVTLAGEPVKLRNDGTFTVRLSMPDRRQVLPVVAASSDGVEQRTIVLAVERNTKVMEPMVRESGE